MSEEKIMKEVERRYQSFDEAGVNKPLTKVLVTSPIKKQVTKEQLITMIKNLPSRRYVKDGESIERFTTIKESNKKASIYLMISDEWLEILHLYENDWYITIPEYMSGTLRIADIIAFVNDLFDGKDWQSRI